MIVLAIETAQAPAVAISQDGKILMSRALELKGRRTDALPELIRESLKDTRIKPSQINRLAVGLGPGSFTGLRIGVTTGVVWAWANQIPVYGFSRMEAIARLLAADSPGEQNLWVVEDAGRSNVYAACYARKKDGLINLKGRHKIMPKNKKTLTATPGSDQIAEELTRMALSPKAKRSNPMTLYPEYLYPRDCNVTLA